MKNEGRIRKILWLEGLIHLSSPTVAHLDRLRRWCDSGSNIVHSFNTASTFTSAPRRAFWIVLCNYSSNLLYEMQEFKSSMERAGIHASKQKRSRSVWEPNLNIFFPLLNLLSFSRFKMHSNCASHSPQSVRIKHMTTLRITDSSDFDRRHVC
jgi:hypothetical protein